MEHLTTLHQIDEDNNIIFGDDDDLQQSLEKARKIVLENRKSKVASGPQAIALLASSIRTKSVPDNQNPGELPEKKIVFTEMDQFVSGLQPVKETHKPDYEVLKTEDGGWIEKQDIEKAEPEGKTEEVSMHEVAIGKGLSGALNFLNQRGSLKESIEWGGRNMDKKKRKLVGMYENQGEKEIIIERTDEYGRVLTPNEDFRQFSHRFHGKYPGKKEQQKRINRYEKELKVKQMKNSDTPLSSVERLKKAQVQSEKAYIVLY